MISIVSRLSVTSGFSKVFRTRLSSPARHSRTYYEHLSRNMSYALRHNPDGCGLTMDNKGFVPVDNLLAYLKLDKRWKQVNAGDIISVVENSDKTRFQLDHGQIRAYYGHSFSRKIQKEAQKPPKILFHGTSHAAAEKILREGLTPQSRQYVHLSANPDVAFSVGRRRDAHPVIFKIKTRQANNDGILFYPGNQDVWLADKIPPKYIVIC